MILTLKKFLINEFYTQGLEIKNNFNITTSENELFLDNSKTLVMEIIKTKFELEVFKASKKYCEKTKSTNTYIFMIDTAEEFMFDTIINEDMFEIEKEDFLQNGKNFDELIKERDEKLKELIGMYLFYSIKHIYSDRIGLSRDGSIYLSDYLIAQPLLDSGFEIILED